MVTVPPVEKVVEDWRVGMLATPPIRCPNCGKLTRAKYDCQWCKKNWSDAEIEFRRRERLAYYSQLDPQTKVTLSQRGYYNLRVP